jgi:hypothetical protein
MCAIYVGVDLRGANIRMTQQFLNHAKIRAASKQVCGK